MLLVIRRYILILPIFRLILQIIELSVLLNAHEEPIGTPDQYSSVCMNSPGYLPIPSHLGLVNLILVIITRYSLKLPILRPILLILGLFGLLKANEGHLGTPNQYFYFECVVLVVIYLFLAIQAQTTQILGVLTRYSLKLPILRLILLILGLFDLLKTHEGHLETPNQYLLLWMSSPSCYLPISCQLRFKQLRFQWL